ncbi:MAG: hypothetical protein ABL903_01165 [Methylococcales bacterium]
MNKLTEEDIKHDKFWLIIGAIMLTLVTLTLVAKHNEEAKYSPIKTVQGQETSKMNARVMTNN